MLKKILKWIGILAVAFVALWIGLIVWFYWGYYDELNQIKKELEIIEGVSVINIWGHEDIELEEISARISIKNKGTIVLNNLSKDSFDYPAYVSISEINGKSFEIFTCGFGSEGIGSTLNIGTSSCLAQDINKEFKLPKDVIENFDLVEAIIDSIPRYPNYKHYIFGKKEYFLTVYQQKSADQDPIFNLIGIENRFEFATKLNWQNEGCFN